MSFFNERVKNLFKDLGIRYDVVDVVLSFDINDVFDMYMRVLEFNNWLEKDELVEMFIVFNRVFILV